MLAGFFPGSIIAPMNSKQQRFAETAETFRKLVGLYEEERLSTLLEEFISLSLVHLGTSFSHPPVDWLRLPNDLLVDILVEVMLEDKKISRVSWRLACKGWNDLYTTVESQCVKILLAHDERRLEELVLFPLRLNPGLGFRLDFYFNIGAHISVHPTRMFCEGFDPKLPWLPLLPVPLVESCTSREVDPDVWSVDFTVHQSAKVMCKAMEFCEFIKAYFAGGVPFCVLFGEKPGKGEMHAFRCELAERTKTPLFFRTLLRYWPEQTHKSDQKDVLPSDFIEVT